MAVERRTKTIFIECAVYKIYIPPDILDSYLPEYLPAYRANTKQNLLRRIYFFSKLLVPLTRNSFDDYIDQIRHGVSFSSFLKKLSIDYDPNIRYNFVILDDYAIFIRAPYPRDESYHILCKHITISSRAKYARFAGEIWCTGRQHYAVNNNSGTYRPSDRLIEATVQLFQYLVPNAHFQGASFRFN